MFLNMKIFDTLAVSSEKRYVMVWRLSVCLSVPSVYLAVTRQETAYDATSVHLGLKIKTNILVRHL